MMRSRRPGTLHKPNNSKNIRKTRINLRANFRSADLCQAVVKMNRILGGKCSALFNKYSVALAVANHR